MNTKEKAKAYDNAIKVTRRLFNSPRTCFDISQLEEIFPELKESEDERIRKHLIDIVEIYWGKTNEPGKAADLAWLEKQKRLFGSGRGLYYYDGEKTIYCGYPASEENPYDLTMSQQEKQKERKFDTFSEYCNPDDYEVAIEGNATSLKKKEQKDYRKLYEDIAQSEWFKKNYAGKSLGEEKKPLTAEEYQKTFDELYKNHPWYMQKHTLKFKVGDKVHLEGDEINILTITGIGEDRYFTDCSYGPILFGTEDMWQIVEQKPELPKPHKGDDNNPYDMGVSEAQEYAIKRGFGIPFNNGEVFVDEQYITQTIGNILRWADEHPKEQKPVKVGETAYFDPNTETWFIKDEQKPRINIDQLKSLMLQYLQEAANEKDDSDIEADTDKWARKILGYDFEQKSAEIDEYKIIKKHITEDLLSSEVNKRLKECGWYVTDEKPTEWNEDFDKEVENIHKRYPEVSFAKLTRIAYHFSKWANKCKSIEWSKEDEEIFNNIIEKAKGGHWIEVNEIAWLINRFKSLRPQPKQEWSEAEEETLNGVIDSLRRYKFQAPNEVVDKQILWLKSLRPSWKPSKEQMEALLGAEGILRSLQYDDRAKILAKLYEQLKKL